MGGLNWIDVIIFLLVANAFYNGLKIGFTTLALGFGGFFTTLFLGGWIFPHLLPISNQTLKAVININLILFVSLVAAIKCGRLGQKVHVSLGHGNAHLIESAAGVTLSVSSALLIVWMLAAGIGSLPFAGMSNSANDSFIVQSLDRHLPPVPAVFERFSKVVDPNTSPKVIVKQAPNSSIGSAPLPPADQAVIQAGSSVVRITSFGCGGIVDGSGFVIAPGLVATNAHVIAGVHRPIIKSGLQSIEGEPVLFDPGEDFAVLRVKGLKASPLKLQNKKIADSSNVYTIGYPRSIFTISPGLSVKEIHVLTTNIYGFGSFDKDIYEIQASIDNGDSGGPVVTPTGTVAGVVFAKSSSTGYAYALSIKSLAGSINQAKNSQSRIGTGACLAS